MAKKETINNVFIAGQLVKKDFEIKDVDVRENGNVVGKDKAIMGQLIIRTADGSEHEVRYYSRKTKKDGSENGIYKGLETVLNEYRAMEQYPNEADIVKIGAGQFNVNDYKGNDGDVKTYTEIRANFVNRLTDKEIETTPLESKFEVEGVIEKIEPEMYKNEVTGNLKVTVNVLGYEGTIIPVVLTVSKEMAGAFQTAGFFEGGFAKFTGKLINTKEVKEVVEKMAFGTDNVKVVTTTVSRKEITGGNPMGSLIENDIDEHEYEQAKAKRKLKLDKIKNEEVKNNSQQSSTSSNPFAGNKSTASFNPFANRQ